MPCGTTAGRGRTGSTHPPLRWTLVVVKVCHIILTGDDPGLEWHPTPYPFRSLAKDGQMEHGEVDVVVGTTEEEEAIAVVELGTP
ncbi:hypothetical protein R3I94_008829 [Phoxinus phoxinus]